jgi:hypothetical protein
MSTEEQLSVRSALPSGVASPVHVSLGSLDPQSYTGSGLNLNKSRRQPPSLLHRTLASTILHLFLLAQLLLPYLRTVLTAAYKYEREHRVGEKVLASSMDAVDAVGRRSVTVGGVVWGLGVGEAMAWIVEGITGGISEGVEEGLLAVGARKDDDGR